MCNSFSKRIQREGILLNISIQFWHKKVVIGLVLLLVGVIGLYFYEQKTVKVIPVPIEVFADTVTAKDVPVEITEVGNIIPYQTVAIKSRIDSQIVGIYFKDGDKVEAGQMLMKLDDLTLKTQLSQLEANVARDQAQLDNYKKQYERTLKVFQTGFDTKQNLDNAQGTYEAQIATVNADNAAVENMRAQFNYTIITAPISGRTGTISLTVGNEVKANDTLPIVTINQIDPIKAQFSISQKYFDQVQSAMRVGTVEVRVMKQESHESFVGHLEHIENTIDQNDNFASYAIFPNGEEKLWPGMYVNLIISLGTEKDAITTPVTAIQNGPNNIQYVYVIESGKAKKRIVKVSRIVNNMAVINEGLKSGDEVITDGILNLQEGTDVKIGIKQ